MAANTTCYHFDEWIKPRNMSTGLFSVMMVFNAVSILPTVSLNFLIILSICKTTSLKSVPSMVLTGNIALSDLVVGMMAQPFFITHITLSYIYPSSSHRLSCGIAIGYGITSTLFGGVSMMSMAMSSVDRYLALSLHLRYPAIVTSSRLLILCTVCWFGVLAGSLSWIPFGYEFYNFGVVVCLLVCLSVTSFCYGLIYRNVRAHKRRIHQQVSNVCNDKKSSHLGKLIKSSLTAAVIYGVFICCYLAHFVVSFMIGINDFHYSFLPKLYMSATLIFINSAINPVVFLLRITDLRQAFRRVTLKLVGLKRTKS